MRNILKELDEFNKTYILKKDNTDFMKIVEKGGERDNLNKLQRYELDLNESYFEFKTDEKLFK